MPRGIVSREKTQLENSTRVISVSSTRDTKLEEWDTEENKM